MADYLVSTTLKCLDGHASRMFDELLNNHQVGGLFITAGEGQVIADVVYRGLDFVQIPCRIREVAAYFACLAPRRKLETEEMFNICRMSLGLSMEKMKSMRSAFLIKHKEDPESLAHVPIYQFLGYIIKTAEVKEEQFIIDNTSIVKSFTRRNAKRKVPLDCVVVTKKAVKSLQIFMF